LEDNAIVLKVLNGDADSFRLIVESYEGRLRSFCLSRLPASEIDDAMQDIFIKAFRSLKTYDPGRPFGAWFFTVASSHVATRKLRFWRERTKRELARRNADPAESENGGQAALEAEMVRALVRRLRGGMRKAVELHYFAGLSVKEIAQTLSIGESAAKQRLARARRELLAMMEDGK